MAILGIMLTILLLVASCLLLVASSRKSSKLPPGRTGWPIIGEALRFKSSPSKFIRDRMIQHSPTIFKTSFGDKMVVLCGAAGNKFLYTNEDKFTNWLPKTITKLLQISRSDSPTLSYKVVHEQIFKIFKLNTLPNYITMMDNAARDHIDKFWLPYKQVKVQPLAREYAFAVSCLFLLDSRSSLVEQLREPYFGAAKGVGSIAVNIPGTTFGRAMSAAGVVVKKLEGIIRERKLELSARRNDGDEIVGEDLLTRIVKALNEDCHTMDDKVIARMFLGLVITSFFATSSAMAFVLHFLAKNPEAYVKVLQENLEIMNSKVKGEPLSWKDIHKMKYSWNAACESIRLLPSTQGGYREIATDLTYEGFTIPKGWKVHWSVHSTNKDPKYFPDPEKFDPSRFEQKLPPGAFMPFGAGPHMCLGIEYARIMIVIFIYNVVTRFKLQKVNPNEAIIYTPDPVAVEGLRMYIQPHDQS